MKVVDSSRRQIVMGVLLALAAAGAAIRHWAPQPSLARDIGTLLLVLWLPAVGNLVAFAVRTGTGRWRRRRDFSPGQAFRAQVHAEIVPGVPLAQAACTVVVGTEGFTARIAPPRAAAIPGIPAIVDLEFLRPALALPRLPPGTEFQLLAGSAVIATGRVLSAAAGGGV